MDGDAPAKTNGALRAVLLNSPLPATTSPQARALLATPPESAAAAGLAAQRSLCLQVQTELGGRMLERWGVTMVESQMDGVPVRIFTPRDHDNARDDILFNLHGGGFTQDAGSITENVPVAALTGRRVIAALYRLAPEHPYPAAVDDAEAVYRVLLSERPASQIGLYGTSAGAILGTQLLHRLNGRGVPLPRLFGFFSGSADLSRAGDSEYFFRPPDDPRPLSNVFEAYTGAHDTTSPVLSPLLGDVGFFPPTLCIAGTRDFFLSQTALFHQALLAAGVAAELAIYEAMPHAHWIYLDLPESEAAFRLMADFIRRRMG